MKTSDLVQFLDDLLNIKDIQDDSQNGLQVENSGQVNKVALAVDASLAAFQKTREKNADFLLVHHGLFWNKPFAITGQLFQRIQSLIQSDIALYAAHLPLDLHPELGNNAQVEQILNWPVVGEFGDYHGITIGKEVKYKQPKSVDAVLKEMAEGLNCEPQAWRFGSDKIQRIAYVSGGGLSLLQQAIESKMDAFITGEPKHGSYWMAKEAGINVIFAGHYATETLGVKAVGKGLEKEFDLETVFIDLPTGH